MPIYEYGCRTCSHTFEQFFQRSSTADAQTAPPCPMCTGAATERRISQVAFLKPGTAGVGRAAYPTSWEEVRGGDPETVRYWQRRVENDRKEEARDPELVGLRERAALQAWNQEHPPAGSTTPGSPASSAGGDAHEARPQGAQGVPFITPGAGHAHGPGHQHTHAPATGTGGTA